MIVIVLCWICYIHIVFRMRWQQNFAFIFVHIAPTIVIMAESLTLDQLDDVEIRTKSIEQTLLPLVKQVCHDPSWFLISHLISIRISIRFFAFETRTSHWLLLVDVTWTSWRSISILEVPYDKLQIDNGYGIWGPILHKLCLIDLYKYKKYCNYCIHLTWWRLMQTEYEEFFLKTKILSRDI